VVARGVLAGEAVVYGGLEHGAASEDAVVETEEAEAVVDRATSAVEEQNIGRLHQMIPHTGE
jgi:hypothetical protein